jgi:hypothetical protein
VYEHLFAHLLEALQVLGHLRDAIEKRDQLAAELTDCTARHPSIAER